MNIYLFVKANRLLLNALAAISFSLFEGKKSPNEQSETASNIPIAASKIASAHQKQPLSIAAVSKLFSIASILPCSPTLFHFTTLSVRVMGQLLILVGNAVSSGGVTRCVTLIEHQALIK